MYILNVLLQCLFLLPYSYFRNTSGILRKGFIYSSFNFPSFVFSSKIRNLTLKVTMIDAFKILDIDGDGQISVADIEEANFVLFKNDGTIYYVLFNYVDVKIKLRNQ